jgi:putative colanic acid biosynthesis acetyltransferase WcaF
MSTEPPIDDRGTRMRLDRFTGTDIERGRPKWLEAWWYLAKCVLFLSAAPWPSAWKVAVLRAFGATIGEGVVIKPRVNIHLPWKLAVGDHAWIGEEVFILNLDQVTIGSHACISQRAFLCTGNHDYRDPAFRYFGAPITIADGAWVGAQVFVAPGTRIGTDAVIVANSRASGEVPAAMICDGSPARPIKPRWPDEAGGDREASIG